MSDADAVLRRVLTDLAPDHAERVAGNRAQVVVGGQPFAVEVATRGRMMLRITEATFVATGPRWSDPLSMQVTHTGRWRPTGTAVRIRTGDDRARDLADVLSRDPALRDALLPLDFTRFTIKVVAGHLTSTITLMGASMTRMRVPPTSSYVRLHQDQRRSLLATFAALGNCWEHAGTA